MVLYICYELLKISYFEVFIFVQKYNILYCVPKNVMVDTFHVIFPIH
jgi:hypothetical protein